MTSSHFSPTHLASPCLYLLLKKLINDISDSVSNVWIVSVTCQIVSSDTSSDLVDISTNILIVSRSENDIQF